jgi:25S rRNA (uracil2634-N3)-methyltransferase
VVFRVANVSERDNWIETIINSHACYALLRLSPSRDHLMAGKKKSSLQTALLNQQSRLKQKAQIAQAAKSNEKTKAVKKQTGKKVVTIPFAPTDKILLIGEGNFSYAYALAVDPPSQLQHLPPQNITATAYDSEEECIAKYADAQKKIGTLRDKGVNILFGVDATKLEKVSQLKGTRWDKVVWNFPHAGAR